MSADTLPGTRLHHTGFLVGDIAGSARDFVERFGYVIESEVIEDPAQTACVQFLRQPGTTSWLELIAPNGAESKLANALRKGGGLHHLCYEVAGIERSCELLRQRSMLVVSPPTPAVAFPGRRIAWLMDRSGLLVELLERGAGALALSGLTG
jgi:methylmalonyl-CoA/ethylmalonyl-CoA epimerase